MSPKRSERIVEVLLPLMIPLQISGAQAPPPPPPLSLGGGPEDLGAFLYWIMNQPKRKRRTRRAILSRKLKRIANILDALDAVRTLQLAREIGQFS